MVNQLNEDDEDFEELVGGTVGHRATNAAKYKSQLDAEMLGLQDPSLSLFAVEEEKEHKVASLLSSVICNHFLALRKTFTLA